MKYTWKTAWIRISQYIGVSLLVLVFICPRCFMSPMDYYSTIGFTLLITALLFEGNGWLNFWIGRKVSWVERPVLRTVLGVGGMVIYTSGMVVLMYLMVFIWGKGYSLDEYLNSLLLTLGISMATTLVVALVLHAREFLFHWREAALRVEKLRSEQIHSRFTSLKAQLNPHFLFNSLNVLTTLVYKDAEQAAAFIKKLSEMYRYILEYVDEEVVSLKKEMKCLEAYIYLLKIRHGEHLRVEVDVPGAAGFLPPLSLQMLLENATKHNIISQKKPLKIEIIAEENKRVIVRSTFQPKEVKEASTGRGLANIRSRYELLTDQPVEINQHEKIFEVKLPLLTFDAKKLTSSSN